MSANRKEAAVQLRISFLMTTVFDRAARTCDAGKSAEHRGQRRDRPLAKLEDEIKYRGVPTEGPVRERPDHGLSASTKLCRLRSGILVACLTSTSASSIPPSRSQKQGHANADRVAQDDVRLTSKHKRLICLIIDHRHESSPASRSTISQYPKP